MVPTGEAACPNAAGERMLDMLEAVNACAVNYRSPGDNHTTLSADALSRIQELIVQLVLSQSAGIPRGQSQVVIVHHMAPRAGGFPSAGMPGRRRWRHIGIRAWHIRLKGHKAALAQIKTGLHHVP